MEKIRYGIIGCGSMGREHIENIRALGSGVVTAVADPDAGSRAQAAALLEGQVRLFERHQDLLDSGLVDAVVVASPNFTHIEVMRDALLAPYAALPKGSILGPPRQPIGLDRRAAGIARAAA